MVGLGEGEDTDQLTQAVLTARLLVSAYTRGRGVTDEGVAPPLGAVVALAAMRLYANPTQLDNFIGSVGYRQGFTGWTQIGRASCRERVEMGVGAAGTEAEDEDEG